MKPIIIDQKLLDWLLDGDVAIQYQVHRDLLDQPRPDLQARIATEGWGARFLSYRKPEGYWGRGFYQVKWISSHYTILDLRHLEIAPNHPQMSESIRLILDQQIAPDGGVSPSSLVDASDVCINGMFLHYACYFKMPQEKLTSIIDFIISVQMADGGFNCRSIRSGAVHSSTHSTLSMLEGIETYRQNDYTYRLPELLNIAADGRQFLLQHQLFRSDKTGEIIDKRYLMLSYPSRWRYDILRALDYFAFAKIPYDERMAEALEIVLKKRRKDGTWPVQARHPGQTHFDMEKTGGPSRWNTLRVLRTLRHFGYLES